MQIDNFHVNSSAPQNFQEALIWRERVIGYVREKFPDVDLRVKIKESSGNFKIIVLCSSESVKRSIDRLDLAVDINFKPWYGAGEKI